MNKILKGITLSMLAVAGLASCSSDSFDYTPADAPTGAQVYFPTGTATEITIIEEATSFAIMMNRANVEGDLTVPLTVTGTEGTIYSVPTSVSFRDGVEIADLVVSYDPTQIEYGRYDTLTVAIDPEMATPYGIATLKIVVGATAWVDYGTALYREDIMTTFYGVQNLIYEVPIEKNIVKEGYYRLVNPYGEAYPYNEEGDWDETATSYMTVNAEDPDMVYIEYSPTTMDWGYGPVAMQSMVSYYMDGGYSLEEIKSLRPDLFGTLKDGIITMPTQSLLINMPDYSDSWYYGNTNGMFGIALPGAVFADYSIELSYAGTFTDTSNTVFAVGNLTLGEDATDVKAVVVYASDDAAAVADAIAAGDLEATSVKAGRIEVPIAEGMSGKLQIVAVVLDGNEAKASARATFEYYGGGVNPWKSLGTGIFIDDFVIPIFGYDPEAYYVEVQESTETPGLYRLVDAYAPIVADFGEVGGYENIEVHAEDPEGVYVLEQPIGWDAGYGDMAIATVGGDYVAYYGFDIVKQQRPDLLGTLEDGVITFPSFDRSNGNGIYQGYLIMGEDAYYGGMNGSFEIYLPSALKNSAKLKAQAEGKKKAADFSRRLNAYKVAPNAKRAFVKKIVKASKKAEMVGRLK